jgi:hypothetical protein
MKTQCRRFLLLVMLLLTGQASASQYEIQTIQDCERALTTPYYGAADGLTDDEAKIWAARIYGHSDQIEKILFSMKAEPVFQPIIAWLQPLGDDRPENPREAIHVQLDPEVVAAMNVKTEELQQRLANLTRINGYLIERLTTKSGIEAHVGATLAGIPYSVLGDRRELAGRLIAAQEQIDLMKKLVAVQKAALRFLVTPAQTPLEETVLGEAFWLWNLYFNYYPSRMASLEQPMMILEAAKRHATWLMIVFRASSGAKHGVTLRLGVP